MKLGIGNVLAVVGFVGIGIASATGAPGCTATVSTCSDADCVGSSNGGGNGTGGDNDGAAPPDNDAQDQGDTGSIPFNACNSCLYDQCVGTYSNCAANTSCLTIFQCATAPSCASDGTCVQTCFDAGDATGKALYVALGDCDVSAQCATGASCATACAPTAAYCASDDAGSASDDASAGQGADAAAGTCDQCQAQVCASELAACTAGTACATYNQCVLGCTDATCATACQTNNPTGSMAATALGTCTTNGCPQCAN
jgi:hypothetical protein